MNTKKVIGVLALLPLLVGQAVQAQMVPEIEPVAYEADMMAGILMDLPVTLTGAEKEALKHVRRWRNNPDKPAPAEDGGVVYTFGSTLPTILCAPGQVCAIWLEPGEAILKNGLHVGDPKRVKLDLSKMGDRDVVIVKITQTGITSNIIINTDRRSYTIQAKGTKTEYIPYIEFVYPENMNRVLDKYHAEKAKGERNKTMSNGQRLDKLDFNYRISGDNPKWKPIRVYSDGRQMTIQFPSAHFEHGAPALAGLGGPGGAFSDPEYDVVNYRPGPDGDTYIVDKLLDRAVLVSGSGKSQVRVDIEYTGGNKK